MTTVLSTTAKMIQEHRCVEWETQINCAQYLTVDGVSHFTHLWWDPQQPVAVLIALRIAWSVMMHLVLTSKICIKKLVYISWTVTTYAAVACQSKQLASHLAVTNAASALCKFKQCQQQALTCCLQTQQDEDSARDCISEGAGVWQPRFFLVGLGDVIQAAWQKVMRSKGAEDSLDDLVGPQHPFLVKEHVDHV